MVRRAIDLQGFLAAPAGAFLSGDSFAFYNLGTLCGWRVWGRPSRDEALQLVTCIATAYAAGSPPYFSLVDLRKLEGVDAAGFEVLLDFVKSKKEQMATQLVRQAVVRPAGLLGALSSGFYVLLEPSHRVQVFDLAGGFLRMWGLRGPVRASSLSQQQWPLRAMERCMWLSRATTAWKCSAEASHPLLNGLLSLFRFLFLGKKVFEDLFTYVWLLRYIIQFLLRINFVLYRS